MGNYSPKSAVCLITHTATGITHELTGWTTFAVDMAEDVYKLTITSDGFSTRTKNANTSGKFTVTLKQGSSSNDFMSEVYYYDKVNDGSSGVFQIDLRDMSGRSIFSSSEAFIGTLPSVSYANEVADRVWVIQAASIDYYEGGNGLVDAGDTADIEALGGTVDSRWQ